MPADSNKRNQKPNMLAVENIKTRKELEVPCLQFKTTKATPLAFKLAKPVNPCDSATATGGTTWSFSMQKTYGESFDVDG